MINMTRILSFQSSSSQLCMLWFGGASWRGKKSHWLFWSTQVGRVEGWMWHSTFHRSFHYTYCHSTGRSSVNNGQFSFNKMAHPLKQPRQWQSGSSSTTLKSSYTHHLLQMFYPSSLVGMSSKKLYVPEETALHLFLLLLMQPNLHGMSWRSRILKSTLLQCWKELGMLFIQRGVI